MSPFEQYRKINKADEAEVLVRFERLQKRTEEVNREYAEVEVEADLREATKLLRERKQRARDS